MSKPIQLDRDRNYVLSRPMGGLNDKLNQIYLSYLYCRKHNRDLIVDTANQANFPAFSELFEQHVFDGVKIVCFSQIDGNDLNGMTVFPTGLVGRLDRYEVSIGQYGACLEETGEPLRVDRTRKGKPVVIGDTKDHAEQLVVHHDEGGGNLAVEFLGLLKASKRFADDLLLRLNNLPAQYLACHARYTDLRTDPELLFEEVKRIAVPKNLVLCTDNVKVSQIARNHFPSGTKIITSSDIPDLDGQPIHLASSGSAYAQEYISVVDLFTDLFTLASSSHLAYLLVEDVQKKSVHISGYSLFAEILSLRPDVQTQFLLNGSPELLTRYCKRLEGNPPDKNLYMSAISKKHRKLRLIRKTRLQLAQSWSSDLDAFYSQHLMAARAAFPQLFVEHSGTTPKQSNLEQNGSQRAIQPIIGTRIDRSSTYQKLSRYKTRIVQAYRMSPRAMVRMLISKLFK